MSKKNPFIVTIAIFAILWIISEIVWIAFVFNHIGSFLSILSIFFMLIFMFSWFRILSNSNMVAFTWLNLIDTFYSVIIYISSTEPLWTPRILDINHNAFQVITFWIITLTLILFNLFLVSYIVISNTNLGGKVLKAIVLKNTYRAKLEVEKKKNLVHLHEINHKIMCIDIDHIYPSKEENLYYASILAKNPIDPKKANEAEYLFILMKQQIVITYKFKTDQEHLIQITTSNLAKIKEKFKSNLISEKQINKYILNVDKSGDTLFNSYIGKDIDTINKNESFYNF